MKKKNVFILVLVALAFIFSGCEKINGEGPEENHENDASYRLHIAVGNSDETGNLSYSVIAEPETEYVDVDLGMPDDSVVGVTIYLSLKDYENKTVTVVVEADRCRTGYDCRVTEEFVVKRGDDMKVIHINI